MCQGNQVEELDYHVHDKLLYHLGELCIPHGERVNSIREAHTSLIVGHFGVGKTMAQLQRYFYSPRMIESVSGFVGGCSLCAASKPRNLKLGLYTPLPVPSHPWESVSMDFFGGIPMSKRNHDYLYVVVDRLSKMCILMPCKKILQLKKLLSYSSSVFGFILDCAHPLLVFEILNLLGIFGPACGALWIKS